MFNNLTDKVQVENRNGIITGLLSVFFMIVVNNSLNLINTFVVL